MLTKTEKQQLRGTIFRHLDGLATATSAFALNKAGVLNHLLRAEKVHLSELSNKFNANEGYLNVALRVLSSQSWLDQSMNNENDEIIYSVNSKSEKAFSLVDLYEDAVSLLSYSVKFPNEPIGLDAFSALERNFNKYRDGYGLKDFKEESIEFQILSHIEGLIAAPLIVMMGQNGLFHKYFMEASFRAQEYHKDPESFSKILDFFTYIGWFRKKNETYRFTDKGLFFAKRASAYGVTVSYLPTLIHLDELIFGNSKILKTSDPAETEKHVHREMNVWGSGGAHSTYFKVIDEIIVEMFNKPIDDQPKGILDMGCGNGAFIQHIFDVIEHQTLRGKYLDEHPLLLVGADYNQAALRVTRANLIKADIWAKVVWGDIGRPDLLANDLKEDYEIDLKDLLNVRTFLDHNRIWKAPEKPSGRTSTSTGAYAFEGERIPNGLVEDSFREHLIKWKPYVERFGLLIIELHALRPGLTSENIGKSPATAYEATHGYSDQYILEVDVYEKLIEEAGLYPDERFQEYFPNKDLATVSINLLKGK